MRISAKLGLPLFLCMMGSLRLPASLRLLASLCLLASLFLLGAGPEAAAQAPDREKEKVKPLDYHRHLAQVEKRVQGMGFHIVLQKPFVVIGDDSIDKVKHRAEKTVKWAVDLLKKDFFEKDPERILDIWLFKDKESYEKNTLALFNERPGTPFGYYSETHGALIMNIATGGGTLVHEIVHPFMAANFPACPSWFNEGLASLYEQCGDRDGRITGFTNWRLPGLQAVIDLENLPSFKILCSTTTREFYMEDPGTHYSQARYLCYYLQEKKLLRKFYGEFRKSAKDDPTGYETLKKVLKVTDMEAFQKKWEAFVMKLEF